MPLYPKLSNQAIVSSKGFDFQVPSPLSQAISRRLVQQQQADYKAKDMKLSPLDRAVAGLESAMMMGSMMFEAVQQAPKLLQGEDAYTTAVGNRMYQPRMNPEKSYEYLGDVVDLIEKAQTQYKIPALLPEVAGFAPLVQAANRQVKQGVNQAATQSGMALERSLDKPVTNIMNRGGFGAQMLGSFDTQPAQVIKNKGGNWLGGNLAGGVDKRLASLKTPTIAGETPAQRISKHEALLNDPALNQDQLDRVRYQLEQTKGEAALDKWIESNVGNYVKKEMGTPEDPVRLMLEKRAQEIEAQFQVDMNRASRTRARAEEEPDPRRQANLIRQAAREEEQAKFDRDFANEHATHLPNDDRFNDVDDEGIRYLKEQRQKAGFDPEGMAQSAPAKRWEGASDEAINITRAGDIQRQKQAQIDFKEIDQAYQKAWADIETEYLERTKAQLGGTLTDAQIEKYASLQPIEDKAELIGKIEQFQNLKFQFFQKRNQVSSGLTEMGEENPFVSKLDPETKLYSGYLGDLGIDHVVDVIKQDVAAGRIRPDQLNKLTMDQAIKRTADFNKEQAIKMRDAVIKQTEGFPTYKEYPEEGYKWIELATPEATLPEGYKILPDQTNYKNPDNELFTMFDDQGNAVSTGATEAEALKLYKRQEREQQLADALKYEGDTMGHCVGGYCPDVISGKSRIYSLRDKRGEPHVTVEVQPRSLDTKNWLFEQPQEITNEIFSMVGSDPTPNQMAEVIKSHPKFKEDSAKVPSSIRQIKGKQNAAPKEDYLPFVQDFVRSGEWSEVGDLKNTGLVKYEGKIMTQAEADDLLYKQLNATHPGLTDELGLTTPPAPPIEGMKHGGSVHVSDNPDTMAMEMEDQKFGVGGAAIKRVMKISDPTQRAIQANKLVEKMLESGNLNEEYLRLLHKAQTGARSLPEVIPRARPRTKGEIRGYAQQTADQLNAVQQGKFLRASPEKSENFAGKSFDQWKMEQDLQHDIRPTGVELQTPEVADIAKQKGMLKLGISGDTTIADKDLYKAGKYELKFPSEQQGGPFYGLRKRSSPVSWASNENVLQGQQRDINAFSEAYGGVPVIGQYNAMGPVGSNFAQHFAGANLNAIDITKMTPAQLDDFNELIRQGSKKSGVHHEFPGIEDPSAYTYLGFYPELRKHFNSLMVKPTTTEKYGLPDGRVILHAITEPELRDMPVLTSGQSQFELVTGYDPKLLPLSGHSTYSHDLPMKPDTTVKQTPFPIPAELEFSDVQEYAEPLYQPSEMTRVYQTSSPRQIIDQQHIDEIKQYEDFMRQYTPQSERKKDGGLIKVKRKAGGGIMLKALKAAVAPATKRLEMNFKDVTKPVPELTEAAQKLKAGKLSREEYEALVNKHKPVTPYSFVPQPATPEDATRALNSAKREKFGKTKEIPAGTPTGLRLDIPAYKDHGVWVNSVHADDMPTMYDNVSSVTNAEMVMPEDKALSVATREANKSPFAVIKGGWNPMSEEEAVARATEYLNHPDWVQVGIDPERHGYYYNRATMEPIVKAEEVIQIGPLVLAKNPTTAPKEAFKYAMGGAITGDDLILKERPL